MDDRQKSGKVIDDQRRSAGAIVTGRRLFDYTHGWGGRHPIDVPVFVVTHSVPQNWEHPDAPFSFFTDGVKSAIEQAKVVAGDKLVSVAGPNVVQQVIKAGLMDEIAIELVAVLLGKGIRYFEYLGIDPIMLERTGVIVASDVTHLRYRIIKYGSVLSKQKTRIVDTHGWTLVLAMRS